MHIRNAHPRDWKSCVSLDHSIMTDYAWRIEEQEHENMMTRSFQSIRLPRQVKVIYPRGEAELRADWSKADLFQVAVGDGKVCGYVTGRVFFGHGFLWLHDLVVDPRWRRQSVGSQLVRTAATWARELELRRILIEVQTRNHPGVSFCRSLNFSFCGYNDQHWRTQDIALLFGLNLR
ncbi:MAG: GNAT family N-acetyltransferase [Anaerolineae bacterium]|nr:GNAT family N-acetyltransferase [Anaerolineae bacterium]